MSPGRPGRPSLLGWLPRLLGVLLLGLALCLAAFRAPDRSLESLVARWAPPPSEFLDLDGQLVHYRDEGPRADARPLLLIHGNNGSLHSWEGWVARLREQHRVISFDLPGFGLSGPRPGGDYRDEADIDFLLALMDRLGLDRAVLIGSSLGGQLAWELAALHPQRVAALVLVDAGGLPFAPDAEPAAMQLARSPAAGLLLQHLLPRSLVAAGIRDVYGDPAKVDGALVDRYFELTLREGNREALLQRLAQFSPGRFVDRLPSLRQPTLVLWGGRDRLIPPTNGHSIAAAIPGSRLIVFPELGHLPQEEDPAATVAPVAEFLHSLKP